MHRSGTSALTGVLSLLGAVVGDSLVPSSPSANPKGFWEHAGVVDAHDRILAALGSSWHDERDFPEEWWLRPDIEPFRQELTQILTKEFFGKHTWAVKDPRLCRLLPLWRPLLETEFRKPHIVIILRDPREVAQSLAHRDAISEERANLLWLRHVLDAEKWTRDYPRIVVTFEGLLENWRSTVHKICTALSLKLPYTDLDVQRRVDAFLEPALRHHKDPKPPTGRAARLAFAAYQACLNAPNSSELKSVLTPFVAELTELADVVSSWSDEIQALGHTRSEFAAYKTTAEALEVEVTRIKSTLSWRVTAPLRAIWNLLRKLTAKMGIGVAS